MQESEIDNVHATSVFNNKFTLVRVVDEWKVFTADVNSIDSDNCPQISEQKDDMIAGSHRANHASSLKLKLAKQRSSISICHSAHRECLDKENSTDENNDERTDLIPFYLIDGEWNDVYNTAEHSNTSCQTVDTIKPGHISINTNNISSALVDLSTNCTDVSASGCDATVGSATVKPPRSICTICGKTFSYICSLKSHLRIHSGERPFICEVCGKSFTQSGALHMHSRIHRGIKPYPCTVCEKSFVQKSDLTGHMRSHTGEKAFECSVCKKRFCLNSHLHRHIATQHTKVIKYICSVCGKGLISNDNLKQHQRSHVDSKSFACTMCQRRFNSNHDLMRHVLVHSGVKPFECTHCGKVFNRVCNLNRHVLVIHKSQ